MSQVPPSPTFAQSHPHGYTVQYVLATEELPAPSTARPLSDHAHRLVLLFSNEHGRPPPYTGWAERLQPFLQANYEIMLLFHPGIDAEEHDAVQKPLEELQAELVQLVAGMSAECTTQIFFVDGRNDISKSEALFVSTRNEILVAAACAIPRDVSPAEHTRRFRELCDRFGFGSRTGKNHHFWVLPLTGQDGYHTIVSGPQWEREMEAAGVQYRKVDKYRYEV